MALPLAPVFLHQHRIVNVPAESPRNRVTVALPPVTGELNAIREAVRKIGNKLAPEAGVTSADKPVNRQLAIRVHRHPRPRIAMTLAPILRLNVLILAVDEAPNLIDPYALRSQLTHGEVMVLKRERARVGKQAENRHLVDREHAAGCRDAVALDKGGNDFGSLLSIKLSHACYCSNINPHCQQLIQFTIQIIHATSIT